MLTPEVFDRERKQLIERFSRSKIGIVPDAEQIYKMIKKKYEKINVENPDLGVRNFMLPIYHQKMHFKGATSL